MLSDLTFGAFTAYQTFSSLAADHSGRTKRFHDELALFTQPGTLSVLKSKATNTRQEWFPTRILVLNQITIIEIPASLRLLQLEGFHLFYLVNRFETKNGRHKKKQEDLNIFIVVLILEIDRIGNAINVRTSCLLLSALSSPWLVLHRVSTEALPGSTWIMQV